MHGRRSQASRPKVLSLYAATQYGSRVAQSFLLRFRVRPKEEMAELKDSHAVLEPGK